MAQPTDPSFCYDFHCHSRASDGELVPGDLVARAAAEKVDWLALTDHDTHAGLAEAKAASQQYGIHLIAGAEWSLKHEGRDYHVLGLNVDTANNRIMVLEQQQQAVREERAKKIGKRLDRAAKMENSYEKACQLSGDRSPGRPWFARLLVAEGRVRHLQHAFNRYLKKGQSAFVATDWADFQTGIAAIKAAGGVAVLAHPQHYGLTVTKLKRLLTAFCEVGGEGMEVAMPNLTAKQQRMLAGACHEFGLVASGGSDFHSPEQRWLALGKLPDLPSGLTPVWTKWQ